VYTAIAAGILALVSTLAFIKTTMMDPGVFPRPDFDEAKENANKGLNITKYLHF